MEINLSVVQQKELSYGLSSIRKVNTLTRRGILERIEKERAGISIHEHIGEETLHFAGAPVPYITYAQTIETLFEELKKLPWNSEYSSFASMVTPMPVYTASINAEQPSSDNPGFGVYGKHNEKMLEDSEKIINADEKVIPLPFAMIDFRAPVREFAKSYERSRYPIMGLKIHPYARGLDIKDIPDSGYLHFAREHGLPILIHCAREGVPGDLADLLDNLITYTQKFGINLCVAHAGFLHKRLEELNRYPNVYTDISPWNCVVDSHNKELSDNFGEEVRLLDNVVRKLKNQVMYGGDSPYDIQQWSTGQKVGKGRFHDFDTLIEVLKRYDISTRRKVLRMNALRFLRNLPAY